MSSLKDEVIKLWGPHLINAQSFDDYITICHEMHLSTVFSLSTQCLHSKDWNNNLWPLEKYSGTGYYGFSMLVCYVLWYCSSITDIGIHCSIYYRLYWRPYPLKSLLPLFIMPFIHSSVLLLHPLKVQTGTGPPGWKYLNAGDEVCECERLRLWGVRRGRKGFGFHACSLSRSVTIHHLKAPTLKRAHWEARPSWMTDSWLIYNLVLFTLAGDPTMVTFFKKASVSGLWHRDSPPKQVPFAGPLWFKLKVSDLSAFPQLTPKE